MTQKSTIEFQETSGNAKEFLHELNDPDLLRNRRMPPAASLAIRKQQVSRLKENVRVLVKKREEFNKKMEDYIANLTALIVKIENQISGNQESASEKKDEAPGSATQVRCLACETETMFRDFHVLFAKESDDSYTGPTSVYVLDGQRVRKGHFFCRKCGQGNLLIRSA